MPKVAGGEYEVEEILKSRTRGRGKEFLVSWRGYQETTWEPRKNLTNCKEILEKFEADDPPTKASATSSKRPSSRSRSGRSATNEPESSGTLAHKRKSASPIRPMASHSDTDDSAKKASGAPRGRGRPKGTGRPRGRGRPPTKTKLAESDRTDDESEETADHTDDNDNSDSDDNDKPVSKAIKTAPRRQPWKGTASRRGESMESKNRSGKRGALKKK